jgi:hypothetical protein
MRALHWNNRKQIYRMSRFGNSHCRGQARQSAANDCGLSAVARHLLEDPSQQSAGVYERDRRIDAN